MSLLSIIAEQLRKIADNIDSGNSYLSEEESQQVLEQITKFSQREIRMSKYQSARYLNVSERTFDNYIKQGLIPKGKKTEGFKELSWTKKELDEVIKKAKH